MVKRRFLAAGAILAGCLTLVNCGEQDLYKPPVSPYHISGRVSLPSLAQGVDILGNYAYVAAGQSGLQVVDITDPENPRRILWLDTPKFADAIAVARTYDADGAVRDIAFLVEGTEGIVPYDISVRSRFAGRPAPGHERLRRQRGLRRAARIRDRFLRGLPRR